MAIAARSFPAGSRNLASPAVRALMRRRFNEIGGLLLGLLAITLMLALITYDPADPSFDTAARHTTGNLAGPVGAALSDLLLQYLGIAGALPALAMLAWAWRVASHRGIGSLALRLLALLAGVPALAAALSGISQSFTGGAGLHWPTTAGLGGAIGGLLARAALGDGHPVAVTVLICALGLALALTLSLLSLGLSATEWRRAGNGAGSAARVSMAGGRHAAGLLARIGGTISGWLDRSRQDEAAAPEPEEAPPAVRTERRPSVTREATQPAGAASTIDMPPRPAPEPIADLRKARRRLPPPQQESLDLAEGTWRFPPLSLLTPAPARGVVGPSAEALELTARQLETVLADYGVQGAIVAHRAGPVVTLYELEPAPGIRSARVIGLADDVARSLSVTAVRIATVSGRNVIGIEVPNQKRETVYLSEILAAEEAQKFPGRLALALGKDIGGEAVVADLSRMPHLMIAGTTGSGKSVGVNAMILSLLYRLSPDQCRLILIDPKMLELSVYEGIPHLMAPVVTEPAKAVTALKWTVREMERRYRSMSQLGVRNIGGYNDRVADARDKGEIVTRRVQTGFDPDTNRPTFEEQPVVLETLPFIVVVVDEMADLMMVAGKEIEITVQRLAQMARAAGIHVVMATQRPSVDVITGTIKANFPTRISFQVISKFDSRTILGEQGAEQLLGMGDMLYMSGGGRVVRVHGPFVSDREVEDVVAFLREQGEPAYLDEVTETQDDDGAGNAFSGIAGASEGEKGLFDQAVAVVAREGKASTSFIQRHLNIGYNRAAKLIEQMEKEGIVSQANHVGKREILVRRTHDED